MGQNYTFSQKVGINVSLMSKMFLLLLLLLPLTNTECSADLRCYRDHTELQCYLDQINTD